MFEKIKSNKYTCLVLALLSYIAPVSIFGHCSTLSSIYFPFSVLLMIFLFNWKAIEGKEWVTYLSSFLHGFSVSVFGITIFGLIMKSQEIEI